LTQLQNAGRTRDGGLDALNLVGNALMALVFYFQQLCLGLGLNALCELARPDPN